MTLPRTRPITSKADEPLCDAAFALGRLGEAVRCSPVAAAWHLRETAHVAAAFTTRRFGPTRADELFALVAGAPCQRAFASEELLTALAFWRHGLRRWFAAPLPSPWAVGELDEDDEALLPASSEDERLARTDIDNPVERTRAAIEANSSSFPAVLKTAAALARRDDGIGALELAFPLALRSHAGVTLPALALAAPRPGRGADGWASCARRIAVEAGTA